MANWLVVLGHAEGIRWVLDHGQMAFSEARCRRASSIRPADLLFFYVARGAYGHPNRDHAQLLGMAEAKEPVRDLERPVFIGGREFSCGCALRFEKILPERQGVPFEPLIPRLRLLRGTSRWGVVLMGGLIRLDDEDARLLRDALHNGR